jgi:GNAT superfamily N-acetyltransferase
MLTGVEMDSANREDVERLIGEYHLSENIRPQKERIAWAVTEQLEGRSPGLLLVAKDENSIMGVALAVYTPSAELGRVMTVNDFFVRPEERRRGVGVELAERLIERCREMRMDEIALEVLSNNRRAAALWRSVGFNPADRLLFRQKL